MLKRLHLRNFTVFEDANFEFGPGLNVIVGANGTGKSHVLKAGYVTLSYLITPIPEADDKNPDNEIPSGRLAKSFGFDIKQLIERVFQPTPFHRSVLTTRSTRKSQTRLLSTIIYGGEHGSVKISFKGKSKKDLISWHSPNLRNENKRVELQVPVFVPAKEVLTMGWLLPLYDRREIPIDETYPSLLRLLAGPPLKSPEPAHIVAQLQQLIGGKVEEEGGHFYLSAPEQPRMEMNLVAEGVRKFATLYKLLANGTLTPETTLFWDEPEANLNPALLKEMAVVLTELAKAGFQIILATHSLFLLKELHILARQEHKPVRYFGLSAQPGEATTVATADNLELLPNIVALDAELDQSDRFQRVLDQEDANGN